MTYNESYNQALKLKDLVSLYDKKAWIYFIFTSETNFCIKIFEKEPNDDTKVHLQHESVHVNKIPMARLTWSDISGTEVYTYFDPNFFLRFDINADEIMYFESSECESLDLNVLRNDALANYSELLTKLK